MKRLGDRISALRDRQIHDRATTDGLKRRLQRLGHRGRSDRVGKAVSGEQLALELGAQSIAPGVLLLEQRMPSLAGVGPMLDLPGREAVASADLLFIDTETTGLSGGSGTLAFMVGIAQFEGGQLLLQQYLLTRFGGEKTMLEALVEAAGEGRTLVSYNGKSFDMPLLATRFQLAKISNPFAMMPHIDLLHWVRRAFSARWSDCRLGSAEEHLLDYHRRDDLPGSKAPAAWFDWIRGGEGGQLVAVARHNRWDLHSLARLVPKLSPIYRDPTGYGADELAVARFYLAAGEADRALSILERGQLQLTATGSLELARLLRRQGHVQKARNIWLRLAAQGDEAAREQLAKHYEHTLHDCRSALAVAQQLAVNEKSRHRCRRLRRKLSGEARQLPFNQV